MKRAIILLSVFTCLLFGCFCNISARDEGFNFPKGFLIYTTKNNEIHIFDFKTMCKRRIYQEDTAITLTLDAKIDQERFLFSSYRNDGTFIKEFNLKTGQIKDISEGFFIKYLNFSNKLLFNRTFVGRDWVYEMDLNNPYRKAHKILELCYGDICQSELSKSQIKPCLSYDHNQEVLFDDPEVKDGKGFLVYDFNTKKFCSLSIEHCDEIDHWLEKRQKLVCTDNNLRKSFFVKLNGTEKEYFPMMLDTYISETDQFVFCKYSEFPIAFSEYWLYDLKTGKEKLLQKNLRISSAIYYSDPEGNPPLK